MKYNAQFLNKIKRNSAGMTLIEILIATLILLPAMTAILEAYVYDAYFSGLTREKTIALDHLEDTLEAIKCTPFNRLLIDFPNGVTDGPGGNNYTNLVGGYTLGNEHIVVTYTNPASDPLEILATVSWQDRRGRIHSQSLSTMRTR